MQGEIAYILKGFPRLSETFISNEIHLLETLGLKLRLFSIKPGDNKQVHGVIEKIRAPVHRLPIFTSLTGTALGPWLIQNLPAFTAAHLRLFRERPGPYLRTLALALYWSVRFRKEPLGGLRKVFIKEFLQAGLIAMEIIDSGNIRQLHAHFCHGATTVALFASTLTGIPFSFTAHAKDIYQQALNPGKLLQTKIRRANFVTTCTASNLVYLRNLSDRNNIHLVYHGLDIEQFKPGPNKANPETVQILAVGRFVEKKGFHFLVEACQRLKQRGHRFQCRILGEPGDSLEPLMAQVEKFGLREIVSLEGPVTHEALATLYRQAHIFALPCQVLDNGDRDGIPNVLMEAMASGLAVVSSKISGIPELIDDQINGWLVPEKDVNALAAALESLILSPELRHRLGENARAKICQDFDARQTNHRLLRLFRGPLDSEPPKVAELAAEQE